MMKITYSIAVLLFGASAVKLRRGDRDSDDREPPPVAKEAIECIIAGAEAEGHEIGGKEAVYWSAYCSCPDLFEVDAEHEEACALTIEHCL